MPYPSTEQDSPPFALPAGLPLLRLRLTLRLLGDARLPAYKGSMLRGGFGYAFQRATCPQSCWGQAERCDAATICPYRWAFETPHPPGVQRFHDLQDVPRPFVIDLPIDRRADYAAGEALEFGLTLIGRGGDFLPYFIFGFARLGELGLGAGRVGARLERVEALSPWRPVGQAIYQDGQVRAPEGRLPAIDGADVATQAAQLPEDLRLVLRTPLRVKARKQLMTTLDPAALVQSLCWRLSALAAFHGDAPWGTDYRPVVAQAAQVQVQQPAVRWEEWERRSDHGGQQRHMQLGGLVGSALLRGVPPDVRSVLLAGSLVHAGKACVFGHGAFQLLPA